MNVQLVVIDPQIDFCAPPGRLPQLPQGGALYVPGAEADIARLAAMVRRLGDRLASIHVTLDQHHRAQVFHPLWWVDRSGEHPEPFTTITVEDVETGGWTTTDPALHQRGLDYVRALRAGGRYDLTIWPYHCLMGSEGAAVMPALFEALGEWELATFRTVAYKQKGSSPYTEHYSALKAEVIDPVDASTKADVDWVRTLLGADVILLAGEALSHCVMNTVVDTADAFGEKYVKKLCLLQDATSTIPGFEAPVRAFLDTMAGRGMQVSTTAAFGL